MSTDSDYSLVAKLNDRIKDAEYMKEDKLVKILNHLLHVNMTLDILQKTHVGVTINPLRKVKGKVGETAKELVKKWKKLLPVQQPLRKEDTVLPVQKPLRKEDTLLPRKKQPNNYEGTTITKPTITKPTITKPTITTAQCSSTTMAHDVYRISANTRQSPLFNSSLRTHESNNTSIGTELNYINNNNNIIDNNDRKRKSPVCEDINTIVASQPKRSRTQVYSGRSTSLKYVPSLFDTCMNILIDNIDAIDVVGGVPFFILEPVLSKCSPTQLMRLEEYNPHFIEDSDGLWEKHTNKEFKGVKLIKKEMSWRELYMHKVEERENKMKSITSIIKARQQAREEPVRKAAILNSTPMRPSRQRAFYSRSGRTSLETPGSNMMKNTMKMAKNRHMMTSSRPRR